MTKKAKITYTARQLKAKARRAAQQLRMGEVAAAAFGAKVNEIQYKVDAKTGDRVRLNGAKTHDEMKAFLTGRRGYDRFEMEEEIGTNWERYMVQQGYAVEYLPGSRIYILTTKAAKTYGLPARLPCGMLANYAKAA